MVAVAVTEDENEKIASAGQAVARGIAAGVVRIAVEGQVEEACAVLLQFDAAAADLACAAVDAHAHRTTKLLPAALMT